MSKKYHYFYKITNLINNYFYYGIHSTDNLNDGYMGSGANLHRAYNEYGVENFKKEIVKYFDSRKELELYESQIVNKDLIKCDECYNISLGGFPNKTIDSVLVRDENGACFRIHKTEYYKDGGLKSPSYGMVTVFDEDNKRHFITSEEYKKNKNKYHIYHYDKVSVFDNDGNKTLISKDEYRKNKDKYSSIHRGKYLVKDENDNVFFVSLNDERYLSGELVSFWTNRKHKSETKEKIKETMRQHGHQQKEKNSQFGTCWINDGVVNLKVRKSELSEYLDKGYKQGRFIVNKENIQNANQNKMWINKDGKTKLVYKHEIKQYILDGWLYGRVPTLSKKQLKQDNYILYNNVYIECFNKEYSK